MKNYQKTNNFYKLFKIPIILIMFYFFMIFLKKNLAYYSGNIFFMLQHGLFSILEDISIDIYILLLIVFIFFIYVSILLKKKDELLFKFYLGSIVGLLFGFTAGSMILPILLIYFLIILNSRTVKKLKGDKNRWNYYIFQMI